MIEPQKLNKGDKIATVSPSWGIAGETDYLWRYELGKKRLESMGLSVVPAPNSMNGEIYTRNNPKARADDITWAFDNKDIKAIIANIGGCNESIQLLPYIDLRVIADNSKIFIGYSDVMSIHLFCRKAGLSTFYGHNLLPVIAENPKFHPYSKKWLKKVLFHDEPIGCIEPSDTFTCDEIDYGNHTAKRIYHKDSGYIWLQGKGITIGRLFGGHTGLMELNGTLIEISAADFEDTIFFIEDIAQFFSPKQLVDFIDWLGNIGALQRLKGVLIGKLCSYESFDDHRKAIMHVIHDKYKLFDIPIIANMNFGHTSPMCILPYGALAEINCDTRKFSILDSGVK